MNSLRILFLTDNYPPETNAPANRTYEHCREWVKKGVRVTIITGCPNSPRGKIFPGYKNRIFQSEYIDGIQVVRVWTYISANRGRFRRILDYASFGFSSFWAGLFVPAHIIVATSPQIFTTCAGFLLSKAKRIPWIFELRDLWPESISSVGAMKKGIILHIVRKVVMALYRDCRIIIALTDAFRRVLSDSGIDINKIKVIPNGVDLERFQPAGKDLVLRDHLHLTGKFVVGYLGTLGMAHGIEYIIDCAAVLESRNIHFLFIGDGACRDLIERRVRGLGFRNVTILNSIRTDEVPKYLSVFDIALVHLRDLDLFTTVIPSKIFEACAMRKPVLLGVRGQAKDLIDRYHAGICFEPENKEDFIRQLLKIRTDSCLYRQLQEGCTRLSDDFDRKHLAGLMLKEILRYNEEQ